MLFQPEDTYVHLAADGAGQTVAGGAAFWSMPPQDMARLGESWLVSEFVCTEDWANWEMHPHGEEFVYLLSGDVEMHLEHDTGMSRTRIVDRGAVLVPRGVWHTAKVFAPSRMLFVTHGRDTQHRPT